jgi:hypothetical protein
VADKEGDVPDAAEPYGDPEMNTTERNAMMPGGRSTLDGLERTLWPGDE